MVPILLLAAAALLIAMQKLLHLVRVPRPNPKEVAGLLEAVRVRDGDTARRRAGRLRGPEGAMLRAGVEHLLGAKELIEELMFEKMLEARQNLQSRLSFISLTAASAPLLGLLGTVTGIINTFKLITVFGTGDAKTLSSGISEALITTEFGLIVAIPALLLHAYLSRRSKRLVDHMEQSAVALLNSLPADVALETPAESGTPAESTAASR